MLDKTGWCIRQFVSPKKEKKVREKDEWPQNDAKQKRQLTLKSWISQDRKSLDEALVRRTNGNTMLQTSSPPLPSPLSTQYSLRSFYERGCNSLARSPPRSLSKLDTGLGTPKDLYLGPDELPQLTLGSRSDSAIDFLPSNTSVKNLYQTISTSQIDLLEALALEPKVDGDKTHKESLAIRNPNSNNLSKDIQQLIRETNHAFKAAEFVLTDAITTSQKLHSNPDSFNLITTKMSPPIEPRRQYGSPVPPKVVVTQSESALTQDHKEHRISGSNFRYKTPAPRDSPLILAEMRKRLSIVSSQERFRHTIMNRRTESDGIDHLRADSLVENNLRPSSETTRSTASGSTGSTPLEPFHLEDLPLRIKLAEGLLPDGRKLQRIKIRRSTASTLTLKKSTAVRSSNSGPFNLEVGRAQYTSVSKSEVVLKSTNFSLTTSRFKHGDIRMERRLRSSKKSGTNYTARASLADSQYTSDQAESSNSRLKNDDGAADQELDLPGFQMAISGATNYHWMNECENWLTDGPNPRLEDLEVKVDELVKWCDDFGLDMGRLVKSHLPGERELQEEVLQRRRRRGRRAHSEATAEDAPSVAGLLEVCRHLRIDAEGNGEDLLTSHPAYEAAKMEGEASSKGARDEKGKGAHEGEALLPPSPMQCFDPSTLAKPETFVPMGFNVDHDLRDYLKWKSECVEDTPEGDN